jgi:hypothetical protein
MSNALNTAIKSFFIQMKVQHLILNALETQDFDAKLEVLKQQMQKQVIMILKPVLSIFIMFF